MSGSIKTLQKFKRISRDEIRVRASQKISALLERRGWSSLTKLPEDPELLGLLDSTKLGRELWSAQELLEHFRRRSTPKFFPSFADKEATVRQLKNTWPDSVTRITDEGDRIVAGLFDLLGSRDLSFGDPIDWHLEPQSGKRAPLVHWSKLDYLDVELAGDKKIVWELNRHQFFSVLGQAYWLTSDERYAQTFVAHLDSWMDQNPPKLGINWASSLEVAFRSISWLWAFHFFKDSPSFTSRVFIRAAKFLYLNARHLEKYLSTYFSPNTHLTGEALGLFYLGLLLPEFQDASRWLEIGKRVLLEQLPVHVRPDGVYFEQSSYYHRYTVDFYTHFLVLSLSNGEALTEEVQMKLKALLDHLMYITRPDGMTPLFGDDDGGRLVVLDRRRANDFRATLSTGAALFARPDYKFVAGAPAEETLWLLGTAGLADLDRIAAQEPLRQSIEFNDGGFYVMRDAWTRTANYLLFDCGPHGQSNCGHSHADALSFELAANGRAKLVDPGTYTYTGSAELRDWFRSSSAHNTLTIDGRSSSISAGPFSWNTKAQSDTLAWLSRNRFDYVKGGHDGYSSASDQVKHVRSIVFLKHDYWVIRDEVSSRGKHEMDVWFHFDSGAEPLIEVTSARGPFIQERAGENGLDIYCFCENGRWRREDGWVSHCYSRKEPARVYVYSAPVAGTANVVTFAIPTNARNRLEVRQIEAVGGHAFEVTNGNHIDVVMIRTGERVETARMASDFEWTWSRFANEALPVELVLLNGSSMAIEGQEIVDAKARISFLSATRAADEFVIETERGTSTCALPLATPLGLVEDLQR